MNYISIPLSQVGPSSALTAVRAVADIVQPAWIAGGSLRRALRNEAVSDVDVFGSDPAVLGAASRRLEESGFRTVFTSQDAVTWKREGAPVVQVVRILAPTLPALLEQFDFAESAFGLEGDTILASLQGILGCLRGGLTINRVVRPAATARRMVKYAKAGLVPCEGTMLEFCRQAGLPVDVTSRYID